MFRGAPSFKAGGSATKADSVAYNREFPGGPILSLPAVHLRAKECQGDVAWTEETMERALYEHVMDFKVHTIVPELQYFDELKRDPRWIHPERPDELLMPCAVRQFDGFLGLFFARFEAHNV